MELNRLVQFSKPGGAQIVGENEGHVVIGRVVYLSNGAGICGESRVRVFSSGRFTGLSE